MDHEYFWLTDAQFARLKPLLPNDTRGVPRVDDRRVISGIIHMLKTGARWRDCPPDYGPYTTIYNRFNRWSKQGVWGDVFYALSGSSGVVSSASIDSTRPTMRSRIPPGARSSDCSGIAVSFPRERLRPTSPASLGPGSHAICVY